MNRKIIGIFLIKNEDLYIEQAIKNIIDFCDEIIFLDNMSTDNTFKIAKQFAQKNSKIRVYRLKDPDKSHKFIEKYANTDNWIFGVDGDEVYDPIGLNILKKEILSGKYQKYWRIDGNILNCKQVDLKSRTAKGYLGPPSRTGTKLYNFSVIKSWKSESQRMHGGNIIFKKNVDKSSKYKLYEKYSWDNSHFRNLHLCFVNRSSLDNKDKENLRLNAGEKKYFNVSDSTKNLDFIPWKLKQYNKGGLVEKDISQFIK